MSLYTLRFDSEPDWTPLERLHALTKDNLAIATIRPWEFMHMGLVFSPGLPDIQMYKHRDSRRYINLDEAGHAYRFIYEPHRDYGEGPGGAGRYEVHSDLMAAIDRLDLDLVGLRDARQPWSRPVQEVRK